MSISKQTKLFFLYTLNTHIHSHSKTVKTTSNLSSSKVNRNYKSNKENTSLFESLFHKHILVEHKTSLSFDTKDLKNSINFLKRKNFIEENLIFSMEIKIPEKYLQKEKLQNKNIQKFQNKNTLKIQAFINKFLIKDKICEELEIFFDREKGKIVINCLLNCLSSHYEEFLNGLSGIEIEKSELILSRIDSRSLKNIKNIKNIKVLDESEKKPEKLYESVYNIEYIKFIYILYYAKGELENILEKYDSYLYTNFDKTKLSDDKTKKQKSAESARMFFAENLNLENHLENLSIELNLVSKLPSNLFYLSKELNHLFSSIIIILTELDKEINLPDDIFCFRQIDFFSQVSDYINYINQNKSKTLIVGRSSILVYFDNLPVKYYHSLNNEDYDFVLGKKNGKINKIMRESETSSATFHSNNIYQNNSDSLSKNTNSNTKKNNNTNLIKNSKLLSTIVVQTADINFIYQNLIDEHPEILVFRIPGIFHRQIIGFEGKNIQKVMKKYGVYVKFMTQNEALKYNGNVLIKTPHKNKESLFKMKDEILSLAKEICYEKKDGDSHYKKYLLDNKVLTSLIKNKNENNNLFDNIVLRSDTLNFSFTLDENYFIDLSLRGFNYLNYFNYFNCYNDDVELNKEKNDEKNDESILKIQDFSNF